MSQILMNKDYFRMKNNADDIIKLQEFLINKNIRQDNLKNRVLIRTMMRETVKKFADRQPMTLEMDMFKGTIVKFNIDYLKEVKLFQMNDGILIVACIEYLLYPGEDNEEYMRIYCCNREEAIELYQKLRGLPYQYRPHNAIVRSARSFFNSPKFLNDMQYLEAIRSYLRSLQINNEDMQYIRNKSVVYINSLEPMNILARPGSVNLPSVTPEKQKLFIDRAYFLEKSNAIRIIKLRNYLNDNPVTEESLEVNANLTKILREGMTLFVNDEPTVQYLDTFRNTILDFTIDHLKEVKLYRMNHGVMAVACIEYLLYPEDDIEEFTRIYSCDSRRATRIYNKLCGFSEDRIQDIDTLQAVTAFFNCEKCIRDNNDYLSNIREYLRDLRIKEDELECIKNESRKAIESKLRRREHEFLRPQLPAPRARRLSRIARQPQPIACRPQPIDQPAQPRAEILLNREYFCKKTTAHTIIRLVEYLIAREIEEEDLQSAIIISQILSSTIRTFRDRDPTASELRTFQNTICDFPIDYLTRVNLFHINHGILVVACVEHVLYPTAGNELYLKIYRCSNRRATVLFNRLCGNPEQNRPENFLVTAARKFFRCPQFLTDNRYLQAIRSYLERIHIDDNELTYITQESIRIIHQVNEQPPAVPVDRLPNAQPPQAPPPPPPNARLPEPEDRPAQPNAQPPPPPPPNAPSPEPDDRPAQPNDQPPIPGILITREYLKEKSKAQSIINLVNYLKDNNITEQRLRDSDLIRTMMQVTTNIFANRNPTTSEIDTFKNTILNVGIDYWTAVSLFRMNDGILAVACVEHVLFPGLDDEEYMRIYRCDRRRAVALYNTLCNLPVNNRPDDDIVKSARSFFNCAKYIRDDDYLSTIREYLGNLQINDDELECIEEKSIELILEAIEQLPAENIVDPVEDQPLAENIVDPVEDQPMAENIVDPVEDQPMAENIVDPVEDQPMAEYIVDPVEDQPMAEYIVNPVEDQPLAENIVDPVEDQPMAECIVDPVEDQPMAEYIVDPVEDQPPPPPPPNARSPEPDIRPAQPNAQPPPCDSRFLITREYLKEKSKAQSIINLVNYLKDNNITEERLHDNDLIRTMMQVTTNIFANRNPTTSEIDTFKNTILNVGIDYWTAVSLFRMNDGILAVACVERLLFPGLDDEEYKRIYRCDRRRAVALYNTLCNLPVKNRPDDDIVKSARSFFNCAKYIIDDDYLSTIREYLGNLQINDDELECIKEKSIELIHEGIEQLPAENIVDPVEDQPPPPPPPNARSPEPEDRPAQANPQPPPPPPPNARSPEPDDRPAQPNAQRPPCNSRFLITREYLKEKSKAQSIINLVNYLKDNNITEERLHDSDLIRTMMQVTTNIFANRNPSTSEIDTFKNTILNVGIDYWTAVSLFRMNDGILAVACVERLLFPGLDDEEYKRIYRCDRRRAVALYNTLCNLPVNNRPDEDIVKSARSFFNCEKYIRDDDYLSTIREYLGNLQINDEELECIEEKSIELIHEAIGQLPAENIVDPVEDQAPNSRENNEQSRPPTPENQQFTLRYALHQKILAYRVSNSLFWPAQIMLLRNHSMTVEFFSFPQGEMQVISSIDDIKRMEKGTCYESYASLTRDLREPFRWAVHAALGDSVNEIW